MTDDARRSPKRQPPEAERMPEDNVRWQSPSEDGLERERVPGDGRPRPAPKGTPGPGGWPPEPGKTKSEGN